MTNTRRRPPPPPPPPDPHSMTPSSDDDENARRTSSLRTSTSTSVSRPLRTVEALTPVEHYSRVIRGACRLTKTTEGEDESVRFQRRRGGENLVRAREREAMERDDGRRATRMSISRRGREAASSVRALSARQHDCEQQQQQRPPLQFALPLARRDVEAVLCTMLHGVTLEDLNVVLAMERQVFIADASSAASETTIATRRNQPYEGTLKTKRRSTVECMRRSLAYARAFARASRFPLAEPNGSPVTCARARETHKQKAVNLTRLERRMERSVTNAAAKLKTNVGKVAVARDPGSPLALPASSPQVNVSKKRTAPAISPMSKRARRNSHEPLVLKLREPKVQLLGSKRIEKFGRDVTNATSAQTRRVVESVSKAASTLVRRNFMSSAVKTRGQRMATTDDASIRKFRLPR